MSQSKKNLIFIGILVAAATIFTLVRGDSAGKGIELTTESISASGPDGFSFSVPFSDVSAAALVEDFSPGVCISGGTQGGVSYGTWENELLGRYQTYVISKLETCVVMSDQSGTIYAFNLESDTTTKELYAAFLRYAEEAGYDGIVFDAQFHPAPQSAG